MPRNTERPLNADEQRFIRHYVREKDIEKAERKARLKAGQGFQFYKRAHVREDIDRRKAVIELEQAKLDAQDIDRRLGLTDDFLDQHLRQTIELDATKFGTVKLKALGLGYVVRARIRQGNSEALIRPDNNAINNISIYQSVFEQQHEKDAASSAPQPASQPSQPSPAPTQAAPPPPISPPAPPKAKTVIRVY